MRVAVIDLGTNTCNLLIAEVNKPRFNILHQSKQLVKIGDSKIKSHQISEEATARVTKAILTQKKIIEEHRVEKVCVFATSAVRDAVNKIPFLDEVSEESGWIIRVVSGKKEADLIFKGVLLALGNLRNPSVILDIGGGSNELIIAHKKELNWKESQPAGMFHVVTQLAISDPIKPNEIETLRNFYFEWHKAAFEQCSLHKVKTLVGCSGTFDTIADIIDQVNPEEKPRKKQEIRMADFWRVYYLLVESTREQRMNIKGMDPVRIDLIVPAMILIGLLVEASGISQIIQTNFALREGVLFELMESDANPVF
ncbi:exopolyphosphatase / guanosine-5'-triphosphate,3'-diphosphate pyrophosphatase [Mariniphaga anaerophila]|uniref:Exopolyphosphatase / guanosine-5'-triphosphate,3'-diphosphate pyrophosphatase n=1 Tax=Mariniphaga anaerophila TaxID=1484053 RepID=A0A1M5E403_9BACT|nr:hypothetical protein [Mariniphaga anaerophila]SHF73915.1 exopolyphosphatase / guanosine-5'-triphosphate,3'-diphosphate pyrophosphatase [Mariniphaga anaerophila]